jgi:NTP pyrophosphatase (non-canonical NTP hydrolase)
MAGHFNGLTPAQDERLAVLMEECAEVIKAAAKIQRHGYHSWNPDVVGATTNRDDLAREVADVMAAISLLTQAEDIEVGNLNKHSEYKIQKLKKYTHHQADSEGQELSPSDGGRNFDAAVDRVIARVDKHLSKEG